MDVVIALHNKNLNLKLFYRLNDNIYACYFYHLKLRAFNVVLLGFIR